MCVCARARARVRDFLVLLLACVYVLYAAYSLRAIPRRAGVMMFVVRGMGVFAVYGMSMKPCSDDDDPTQGGGDPSDEVALVVSLLQ